jgi:creatinine amidohydrolase
VKLAEATWPEVASSLESVVVIPTGSLEQHGEHLPLATDTLLVTAIANRLEEEHQDTVVLTPTLWLGASEHHMAFAGTLTSDFPGYLSSLQSVIRSLASHGFRKFLVVNGHGGNSDLNRLALREVKRDQALDAQLLLVQQDYYSLPADFYAEVLSGEFKFIRHACEAETSLMLHLYPHLVKLDKAKQDGLHAVPPVPGLATSFSEISERGALGRPDLATAEKGQRIFQAAVENLTATIRTMRQGFVFRSDREDPAG